MAAKWQADITVTAGNSTVVAIPAGAGKVRVALDYGGTGNGTAVESVYTLADAVADTDASQWVALGGGAISAATADTQSTSSGYEQAIKLSAATGDQRFVLVGEDC